MSASGGQLEILRLICRWGPLALFLAAAAALLLGAAVPVILLGVVLALCLVLCVLLVWLSAWTGAAIEAAVDDQGVQERRIVVEHGFRPDVVSVEAGRPVRLLFDRRDAGDCSNWVVVPALGVARQLDPKEPNAVEFVATQPGAFVFICKDGVCRGTLRVEAHRRSETITSVLRRTP